MCHCDTCRHGSGVLCTSYYPLPLAAAPPSLRGLKAHSSTAAITRYFCGTCGCHVFRARHKPRMGEEAALEWEVATGTITDETTDGPAGDECSGPRYSRHMNVADTRDGGLSVWLPELDGVVLEVVDAAAAHSLPAVQAADGDGGVLPGRCLCGNVRFHITRPDEDASRQPHSPFPDLMIPYCDGGPAIPNPGDVKWWLRPPLEANAEQPEATGGGRYLAGTCACRSCRLSSGFEIQTWAFVPRANIVFHVPFPADNEPGRVLLLPLNFDILPPGILTPHASSEGVQREFCGVCGATVFWHDAERPELIDVSVGLLSASSSSSSGDGARAESWLDWWRRRVSFSEDAELGRAGLAGRRARELVDGLERGLLSV